MGFITLEYISRSASMDKRMTSETTNPKRKCIEVPSTSDTLSLNFSHFVLTRNFSQFVLTHLGRKLAQLLAYIHRFSGESKQGIRFDQVTLNARTRHIQPCKVKLRVRISLLPGLRRLSKPLRSSHRLRGNPEPSSVEDPKTCFSFWTVLLDGFPGQL